VRGRLCSIKGGPSGDQSVFDLVSEGKKEKGCPQEKKAGERPPMSKEGERRSVLSYADRHGQALHYLGVEKERGKKISSQGKNGCVFDGGRKGN